MTKLTPFLPNICGKLMVKVPNLWNCFLGGEACLTSKQLLCWCSYQFTLAASWLNVSWMTLVEKGASYFCTFCLLGIEPSFQHILVCLGLFRRYSMCLLNNPTIKVGRYPRNWWSQKGTNQLRQMLIRRWLKYVYHHQWRESNTSGATSDVSAPSWFLEPWSFWSRDHLLALSW